MPLEVGTVACGAATDAGLAEIGGLSKLEVLSLTHAQFSDAGLEKLTGLTRLRELDLILGDLYHGRWHGRRLGS